MYKEKRKLIVEKKREEEKERSRLIVNSDGSYELNGVVELTSEEWEKVKERIFSKYADDKLEF